MTTTPADKSWWAGKITPQPLPAETPEVTEILYQSASGSCAFLAAATDGQHYWMKALGNPQGDQALVTEWVCSHIGHLIGAGVVTPKIIRIPAQYEGRSLQDPQAHTMRSGPAYASLHVPHAWEGYHSFRIAAPSETVAGLYAIWDLLLGGDEQWLFTPFVEYTVLSFDHSLWLDRGEGDWDTDILTNLVERPWPMTPPPTELTADSISAVITGLNKLTPQQILEVLQSVPLEWKVPQEGLGTLGWFIYRRKQGTAQRLEALAHG